MVKLRLIKKTLCVNEKSGLVANCGVENFDRQQKIALEYPLDLISHAAIIRCHVDDTEQNGHGQRLNDILHVDINPADAPQQMLNAPSVAEATTEYGHIPAAIHQGLQ